MNVNAGKPRSKGRPTPNKRGRQFDRTIMSEGVYANPRIVHGTLLLVGCNVQVTVKNGGIYEGILKTISPTSQIVLDAAHKVDPASLGKNVVPTKQMLINSLIFSSADVVTITAQGVDMEFANKDNFTDAAISKYNNGGNSAEKELQPWDAEGGLEASLDSLEKPMQSSSSSANGWDAEDMFNVNAEKFKVESSYDPNLSQYTTPLVKKDTKEYREKEARAARLAQEIEKSEDYGKRNALENGDGDDEEMAFSAVLRSNSENNNNSSGVGKYVPPHQRKTQPSVRPTRIGQGGPTSGSPSPSPQQPSPSRNMSTPGLVPQHSQRPNHQGSAGSVSVSVSVSSAVDNGPDDSNDHKNEEDRRSSDLPDRGKSSERQPMSHPGPQHMPPEKRIGNPKPQQNSKIQELVDFQSQFKLKDSVSKEPPQERKLSQPMPPSSSQGPPHPQSSQPPASIGPPPQQAQGHMGVPPHHHTAVHASEQSRPSGPPVHSSSPVVSSQLQSQSMDDKPAMTTPTSAIASAAVIDKKEDDKKDGDNEDKDKKSTLNPFAKEFVPGGMKTRPQQPLPNSTPPRGSTQSPVVNLPVQGHTMYQLIPPPAAAAMMPNPQSQRINKKAVVSLRPDLNAAAAATGQPLLQTPLVQNTPYAMHAAGYNVQTTMIANSAQQGNIQQVFQGMVMQPSNPRMVNPSLMQGATTPTAEPVGYAQGQQPVFVSQQGAHNAMQSYLAGPPPSAGAAGAGQQGPPPHSMAMPTHMTQHPHATPPHSQTTNHMSSQGGASGGHPTPSPVPQPGPAGHPHPQQGHPPSSGTPQPVLYHPSQGNPQQQGHPPLQPSPHTPTSPQAIYPQAMPYSYPQQSYSVVQPHMTTANPQYTTVTHAQHTQHSHAPGHGGQMIMMTQPLQHTPHHPGHNQAVNPQMPHNPAAMAAAATGGGPHPNHQYPMNHAGQHPQAQPVQGGHLHGQAGTGLPMNVSYQQPPHSKFIISPGPGTVGPPFHHNQ